MPRVHLNPNNFEENNGVGQVIKAMRKHLPAFGWEVVDNPFDADLTASHIDPLPSGIDVLHCHGLYWTADSKGPWSSHHHRANRRIGEAARQARDRSQG